MSAPAQITEKDIRNAKYAGFVRHTRVSFDEATTQRKFASYMKQDAAREASLLSLRQNILDGLKEDGK